jgi:hypothetical protein
MRITLQRRRHMAKRGSQGKWAHRFVDHPWLWPAATVVVLLAVAVVLVSVARQVYDSGNPHSFSSVLASGVLGGAGVVVFGAAITGLLAFATEIRTLAERNTNKRLELFHRMRAAHVRIALAQQVLRAQGNVDVYHAQMQGLMQVTKDLEEIREEVRVSGELYAEEDRLSISEGVAQIIIFLQEGIAQYTSWCREGTRSRIWWPSAKTQPRDHRSGTWLVQLVEERESCRSRLLPSDQAWEPRGNMPNDYDVGLEKSKLVMRAYVYGSKADRPDAAKRHG